MSIRALRLLLATIFAVALPAHAHHPGADLDKLMGSEEKYFQPIDAPSAPGFELADANGNPVRLSDFSSKIVVLNFVFASCTDVCPLHSDLIARIQGMVNETPMKTMVQFLTVTTDPEVDTPEVMRGYGEAHGLDPNNWLFLTAQAGQAEDTTRKLAEEYDLRFDPLEDGQQMHGIVTHVIDRGGRFAAKFHGLRFDPLNLVMYVNGLTNKLKPSDSNERESGWLDRLFDWATAGGR